MMTRLPIIIPAIPAIIANMKNFLSFTIEFRKESDVKLVT